MSFIHILCDRIRSRLLREQGRINEEIGAYPAPIAGCDQQFNHLLAQRAAIKGELTRLAVIEGASLPAEETMRSIREFIQASACLDAETKTDLSRAIPKRADP